MSRVPATVTEEANYNRYISRALYYLLKEVGPFRLTNEEYQRVFHPDDVLIVSRNPNDDSYMDLYIGVHSGEDERRQVLYIDERN